MLASTSGGPTGANAVPQPRFQGPPGSQGRFGFATPGQGPMIRPPQPQLLQNRGLDQASAPPPPDQANFTPYYLRPAYRFKPTTIVETEPGGGDGPGRRLRKNLANVRRPVDYVANVVTQLEERLTQRDGRDKRVGAPDILHSRDVLPTSAYPQRPIDAVLNKFLRAAMNKIKCPIYDICWTPEGRRLITGASTGEFTLWNGTAFNFETILQAHDTAIRALKWSHSDKWLVSADHDGFLKYWQANMNNVHMYQAHKEAVRSISFSCTDVKMCTGSDDGTVRVWDFARCVEERICRGHGSDVRSVDWHPQKGLLASGSRDSQQPVKIWDPKTAQCLATLHDHKNSAMAVQWNRNGNWLLTASRDHLIKLYDIRMMREIRSFRGHKKEVTAIAWHPVHEGLFVSGGGDGSLAYWLANSDKEAGLIEHAHDQAIWTLQWHPLGHLLASGSNDNNTKFWTRNKPGDLIEDFHGMLAGATQGGVLSGPNATQHFRDKVPETPAEKLARNQAAVEAEKARREEAEREGRVAREKGAVIPGMGLDDEVLDTLKKAPIGTASGGPAPGMGATLFPENPVPAHIPQPTGVGAKKTLIKQPPPKRGQRQLERTWNASKPMGQSGGGGGGGAEEGEEGAGPTRRGKKSLLGRAPPPAAPQPPKPWDGTGRPPIGEIYGANPMPSQEQQRGPPGPPAPVNRGPGVGRGFDDRGQPGPMAGPQHSGGPPMPPPGMPPRGMYHNAPGGSGQPSGQPMGTQMLGPMWQNQGAQPPASQAPPQPPQMPLGPVAAMMAAGGMGVPAPAAPQLPGQGMDVDYRFQGGPPQGFQPQQSQPSEAWPQPSLTLVDEDWRVGRADGQPDPRQARDPRRRDDAPAAPAADPRASRDPRAARAAEVRDPRAARQPQEAQTQPAAQPKRNWMGVVEEPVDLLSDAPLKRSRRAPDPRPN